MRIVSPSKRKAISPVLATVILIAITLIAAIAIAGFVFGLFGTFTATARVQASVTTCTWNGTNMVCTLILTNSGNANTATTASCSLKYLGVGYSGVVAGGGTVTAGSSLGGVTCTGGTVDAGAGSQITGAVILVNGGNALFSATASS